MSRVTHNGGKFDSIVPVECNSLYLSATEAPPMLSCLDYRIREAAEESIISSVPLFARVHAPTLDVRLTPL